VPDSWMGNGVLVLLVKGKWRSAIGFSLEEDVLEASKLVRMVEGSRGGDHLLLFLFRGSRMLVLQ
jgi:hypothetical protein